MRPSSSNAIATGSMTSGSAATRSTLNPGATVKVLRASLGDSGWLAAIFRSCADADAKRHQRRMSKRRCFMKWSPGPAPTQILPISPRQSLKKWSDHYGDPERRRDQEIRPRDAPGSTEDRIRSLFPSESPYLPNPNLLCFFSVTEMTVRERTINEVDPSDPGSPGRGAHRDRAGAGRDEARPRRRILQHRQGHGGIPHHPRRAQAGFAPRRPSDQLRTDLRNLPRHGYGRSLLRPLDRPHQNPPRREAHLLHRVGRRL